jgi:hypothetical protein
MAKQKIQPRSDRGKAYLRGQLSPQGREGLLLGRGKGKQAKPRPKRLDIRKQTLGLAPFRIKTHHGRNLPRDPETGDFGAQHRPRALQRLGGAAQQDHPKPGLGCHIAQGHNQFLGPDLGMLLNSALAFTKSWVAAMILRKIPKLDLLI